MFFAADGTRVEPVVDEMLQILAGADLMHQLVLVAVHTSQLTGMLGGVWLDCFRHRDEKADGRLWLIVRKAMEGKAATCYREKSDMMLSSKLHDSQAAISFWGGKDARFSESGLYLCCLWMLHEPVEREVMRVEEEDRVEEKIADVLGIGHRCWLDKKVVMRKGQKLEDRRKRGDQGRK